MSSASMNDVGSLKTVYTEGFEKGQWYSIFDNYGLPCTFSSWYSRSHSTRKRMLSNTYSKSSIQSSLAAIRQAQVILNERLLPFLVSITSTPNRRSTAIDVLELWNSTQMDFITAYIFGLKNSSNFLLDLKHRQRWLDLYISRKTYTFFPQELPRLTRFLKKLYIHLVPTWVDDANRELEADTQASCDKTISYIKRSTSTSESGSDAGHEPVAMNALPSGKEKEQNTKGPQSALANETLKYPALSIYSEMIDNLAAGQETSGITLCYLSYHLSQDVPLQDALRAELLTLSPNMLLSTSANTHPVPNLKELDALPLLHAVLMETLRLNAAIPGTQPRMTPYPSCTLGNYKDIPDGVRISARAHTLHRNQEVFPEPEKWDYERWMNDENGMSEEWKRERDRWFWAFSSGGRMCLGSNFAMHAMKLVVAAVYSNFRTHIADDEGIEQLDGYTCGPVSNKLMLTFEKVVDGT